MNWTGGRLQRHSRGQKNTTRSLRAVQKQHFAKVRLAARERRGQDLSPIKVFGSIHDAVHRDESLGKDDGDRRVAGGALMMAYGEQAFQEVQGEEDARDGSGGQQQYKPVSDEQQQHEDKVGEPDIDSIRHRLLEQSDWANISLAKPLRMNSSFPTTERDNLGKRRKLTQNDRQRLNALRQGQHSSRRCANLHHDFAHLRPRQVGDRSGCAPDEISIWIGEQDRGRRDAVSLTPSSQVQTMQMLSQESRESMLFDSVESPCARNNRQDLVRVNATPSSGRGMYSAPDLIQVEGSSPRGEIRKRNTEGEIQLQDFPPFHRDTPLPTLDPRGSFSTDKGKTKYKVPDTERPYEPATTSPRNENSAQSLTALTLSTKESAHPIQRTVSLCATEVSSEYLDEICHDREYTSSRPQHGSRSGRYQHTKIAGYPPMTKEFVQFEQGSSRSGFADRNLEPDASHHGRGRGCDAWKSGPVFDTNAFSIKGSQNKSPIAGFPAPMTPGDGVQRETGPHL